MTNPYQSSSTTAAEQEELNPRLRVFAAAGLSLAIGFGLWLGARLLPGSHEPWDASFPLYSSTMLLGGLVIGLAAPKRLIVPFLIVPFFGVWCGQLIAVFTLPWIPTITWWPLTLIATGIGSLFLMPGLLLGWGIGAGIKRFL